MTKSESSGERGRTITNQVRRLRFENGEITQQQLADRVGVTRQTIIAIESGKYAPSLPLAFRIARAFGLPIEEVFHYEDDNPLHEILRAEP
jgi:putative transcriptional regulator